MPYLTREDFYKLHQDFKSEPGEPPAVLQWIVGDETITHPVTFVQPRFWGEAWMPYRTNHIDWLDDTKAIATVRVAETPDGKFVTQYRWNPCPREWIVVNTAATFKEALMHIDDLLQIKTFPELPKQDIPGVG